MLKQRIIQQPMRNNSPLVLKNILLLCLLMLFFSIKSYSNICEDSIKKYEQYYDTNVVELIPFEKPENFSDGHWNILYINNRVRTDFIIKSKQLEGKLTMFWPNGNKMYEGCFHNNEIYSNWLVFDKQGIIFREFIYKKGIYQKKIRQYDKFGKLDEIIYLDDNGVELKRVKKGKKTIK